MMAILCRLGLHRYSTFPQATDLRDLRSGRVWMFCERCRLARLRSGTIGANQSGE